MFEEAEMEDETMVDNIRHHALCEHQEKFSVIKSVLMIIRKVIILKDFRFSSL